MPARAYPTATVSGLPGTYWGTAPGGPCVRRRCTGLRKLSSKVVIVHAGVGGAGQCQDPRPDRLGDAAAGAPTAVAMGDGGGAVLAPAGQQPAEVAQ